MKKETLIILFFQCSFFYASIKSKKAILTENEADAKKPQMVLHY